MKIQYDLKDVIELVDFLFSIIPEMPVFTTVDSTSETSYRMHVSLRAVYKFKSNQIFRDFKHCSTFFISVNLSFIAMSLETQWYICQ